jgi:type IV secretion system protein VirB9
MKKSISIIISILISFIIVNSNLYASQLPRFLGSEKKFRSYLFNPNDVYRYIGHYNYQGFIEFGPEESVASISMGDPSMWLFEHLNNRLFLKPVGEDDSQTNMTVITNKKVYHFELMAREAEDIDDKNLIFVVKFIYPDEKDKNIVQFQKKSISNAPDMRDLSLYNFNYEYTGDPTIAPVKVFDDNRFTYFEFDDNGSEIPAIFRVDSNGFESLVNFRSADNYIIVESVDSQFTLRNGNEIVCVYNMNRFSSGKMRESTLTPIKDKKRTGSLVPNRVPNIASPSTPIMPNLSPNIRMPGMSY